ncbi:T9SS type A sorting domain-containing protein, partial [Candidatus Poribacteria bacterium]|nr:T9SS type A sorting domain-containing protein [Candidatus Poribacteria bacterium]
HESVVTLTLSGAKFARFVFDIRDAVSVSGIEGVDFESWDVDRVSDTKVTVELTFSGNIDTNTNLVFTVGAGAIAGYNGPALTAEIPVTAIEESLTASVEEPLTEPTLHESVVTLTLSGAKFARFVSDIRDAVSVSGISGVTIPRHQPDKISDTQITVELEFDGDFDVDSTLTFTVGADAIANYNGPALTAQVSVAAIKRSEEYIRGPWLWMLAAGSNIESDQLARVSNGDITEHHVATHGVNEGDTVGALQWTRGRLPLTTPVCKTEQINAVGITIVRRSCSSDNINELVNAIGLSENSDLNDYSAYALINIVSPKEQSDVLMGVGSDDTVKVWLNGEIVHEYLGGRLTINGNTTWTGRSTTGIQDKFYTNLKAGNNLLLVKVSEFTGEWGMFFEIYLGDEDFTTTLPGTISQQPDPLPDLVVEEDVNGDGTVNIQDLVLVASSFGQMGETAADVNGDGVVNIQDLVLVAGAFGDAAAAPSLPPDALEMLTVSDVRQWLSQAQRFGITDLTSQKGIRFLEQLLATLIPQETALLTNYPNPFNPETWIPYQLAKDAEVSLTIYAVDGQMVRRLALGHQPAGMYQNRSRAAYWDGKNASGEPVASGLYFYTLSAGDFTATRKMLIRK